MNNLRVKNIDMRNSLESGQFFHWKKVKENEYIIVFEKNLLLVSSIQGNNLYWKVEKLNGNLSLNDKERIVDFFNIDLDLDLILRKITVDDYVKAAIDLFYGMRILNAPFFETLISFIISAFNNIKRIQGIIYEISRSYGDYLGRYENIEYYSFPTAEQLEGASIAELKQLGLGYRAKYVYETTKKYISLKNKEVDPFNTIQILGKEDIDQDRIMQRELLIAFPGIGKKVSECIMLYSLKDHNAFPIDVWVGRVIEKFYKDKLECSCNSKNCKHSEVFARNYFNGYAGWAQLYLFHYLRNIK